MSRRVKGRGQAAGLAALLWLGVTPALAQVVVAPDSAPPTAALDSARAPSAAQPAPTPAPALAPVAPVDTALARACRADGGIAEGLLLVEFQPDLDAAGRDAVAKAVGGSIAGPATGSADGYYLAVPDAGGLNALADRVIVLAGVESVGPVTCPQVDAAPTPAPAPSPPGSP